MCCVKKSSLCLSRALQIPKVKVLIIQNGPYQSDYDYLCINKYIIRGNYINT